MKKLLAAVLFVPLLVFAQDVKKVCNVQKDAKGREVKVCKDVKVHKKLDGTKVPPK